MDNAALLIQLLTNLSALQQVLTTITQNQEGSSTPESTLPASSNAIIGIVNIATIPTWVHSKPNHQREIEMMEKNNEDKNWKDFLNLPYNTYWSYQFKTDFSTFPVSVRDFVLQKLSENIIENWKAHEKGKNITLPKNKKASFLTRSSQTVLSPSNTINTTNNNNFQRSLLDENSSFTESDKSSPLINKQTVFITLPNRGFRSALPMNESDYLTDNNNNDTQWSFNIIKDSNNNSTIEGSNNNNTIKDSNNNNTQQSSSENIIEVDDNTNIRQSS
ncbi:10053_t:CDS:2, partial [Cetraspora pellucida]